MFNLFRRPSAQKRLALLGCLGFLLLGGCASTRFSSVPPVPTTPLCQSAQQPLAGLVFWETRWRPEQKDVAEREKAAAQGIQAFFKQGNCFQSVQIQQIQAAAPLATSQAVAAIQAWASQTTLPQRVLKIEVRELGPVLKLFASPALLDGGTEVVLDIRELNPESAEDLQRFQVHWQNGGPWVLKGVAGLAEDMETALKAALMGERGPASGSAHAGKLPLIVG